MRLLMITALLALSMFAGCLDEADTIGRSKVDCSKGSGSGPALCVITEEIDGYGLCTFAVLNGYKEAGLTLVGCE